MYLKVMRKKKLNVAVIMGGRTAEHEISLQTGEMIVNSLPRSRFNVKPAVITRRGRWIVRRGYLPEGNWSRRLFKGRKGTGIGAALTTLENDRVDVAFIAMHGPYGEDGTIQGLFEIMDLPYTGANVIGSSIGMDKIKFKELLLFHKIGVPAYITVSKEEWKKAPAAVVRRIERGIGYPCVAKPPRLGSSVGLAIPSSRKELKEALSHIFELDRLAIVEKYIEGTELTCAVLGGGPGKPPVALPVTEIVPKTSSYFDYKAKYTPGATEEITPARIDGRTTARVKRTALKVHRIIEGGGMSRTDMILSRGRLYVLETNTIPGMTKTSLLPQAARAHGIDFPELLEKIVDLAMEAHRVKKSFRH